MVNDGSNEKSLKLIGRVRMHPGKFLLLLVEVALISEQLS